jgi:L-rhamnose mutarotase
MDNVVRSAFALKLKEGTRSKYIEYHKHIWPEIIQVIRETGITNYSIYLSGDDTLFAYMEFSLGASMELFTENLKKSARCREWEEIMIGFQQPLPYAKDGEWWVSLEEVFHID